MSRPPPLRRAPSAASRTLTVALLLGLATTLAACGGADDEADPVAPAPAPQPQPPAPPPPQRGALVEPPVRTASYTTSDLLSLLPLNTLTRELLRLAVAPTPDCAVDVWRLVYRTAGGRDEPATASAALFVPRGTDARCSGPRPLLLYAHGTSTRKSFDIGDLRDPDNPEGLVVAATFAAEGHVVVAPNYAGYARSDLGYHPYLNADQQSKDAIDALAAARAALTATGAALGARLYLTGYSQGGYVALATQRALERAGTAVTASAPLSGPYALAAFGDAIFAGRVSNGAVSNLVLLLTSYQRAYGDLWTTPADAFAARYAAGAVGALPADVPVTTLESQGVLPRDALFPSTPPAERYAPLTPATTPAALAPVFARGFGADALLTNAYRLAYLDDAQANPDGGFPTVTTGRPAASPAHPLRRALARNDLRGWRPAAPVLLCGGSEDPTVFWSNTELVAPSLVGGATVTVLDVDSAPVAGDRWRDEKVAFAAAKAAVALRGGRDAVLDAYHAGLVAPFCVAAAEAFFDAP